MLDYMGKYK